MADSAGNYGFQTNRPQSYTPEPDHDAITHQRSQGYSAASAVPGQGRGNWPAPMEVLYEAEPNSQVRSCWIVAATFAYVQDLGSFVNSPAAL